MLYSIALCAASFMCDCNTWRVACTWELIAITVNEALARNIFKVWLQQVESSLHALASGIQQSWLKVLLCMSTMHYARLRKNLNTCLTITITTLRPCSKPITSKPSGNKKHHATYNPCTKVQQTPILLHGWTALFPVNFLLKFKFSKIASILFGNLSYFFPFILLLFFCIAVVFPVKI